MAARPVRKQHQKLQNKAFPHNAPVKNLMTLHLRLKNWYVAVSVVTDRHTDKTNDYCNPHACDEVNMKQEIEIALNANPTRLGERPSIFRDFTMLSYSKMFFHNIPERT